MPCTPLLSKRYKLSCEIDVYGVFRKFHPARTGFTAGGKGRNQKR
jgi:hypothetical protein